MFKNAVSWLRSQGQISDRMYWKALAVLQGDRQIVQLFENGLPVAAFNQLKPFVRLPKPDVSS